MQSFAEVVGLTWEIAEGDVGFLQGLQLTHTSLVQGVDSFHPEDSSREVCHECVGGVEVTVGMELSESVGLGYRTETTAFHDGGIGFVEILKDGRCVDA